MISSCIIQVSLKSNDKCPYKRQKKGQTQKGGDHVKTEAEIRVMQM